MSRNLPPLNALRAFEATARLNSVSQAAQLLHVTHGAVSRQLKVLEEHLGVSLFVKDGRGLKLTDAGVRLRDASSEAFERLRDVCAELTQRGADAPFVLGCSGSLLARWFIPRLGRLNADLPDLRLHLSAGLSYNTAAFASPSTSANINSPSTFRRHYTLGAGYAGGGAQWSAYYLYAPQDTRSGPSALAAAMGSSGRESIGTRQQIIGLQYSHDY